MVEAVMQPLFQRLERVAAVYLMVAMQHRLAPTVAVEAALLAQEDRLHQQALAGQVAQEALPAVWGQLYLALLLMCHLKMVLVRDHCLIFQIEDFRAAVAAVEIKTLCQQEMVGLAVAVAQQLGALLATAA